jgi:hypothetical protein
MNTDDEKVRHLAHVLGLSADVLGRHLVRPLASPMAGVLPGWEVPDLCKQIFAIANGFLLFGTDPWNAFKFWDSQDYIECCDQVHQQAVEEGLFPFFGEIPHLTSILLTNGSVVSSDWEDFRKPEHGWGEVIALTLQEFMLTLMQIRERYGYDEGHPADWWSPYASHGSRYDLET